MYNSELGEVMLKVTVPTVCDAADPPASNPKSGNGPVADVEPVFIRKVALSEKTVITALAFGISIKENIRKNPRKNIIHDVLFTTF